MAETECGELVGGRVTVNDRAPNDRTESTDDRHARVVLKLALARVAAESLNVAAVLAAGEPGTDDQLLDAMARAMRDDPGQLVAAIEGVTAGPATGNNSYT